MSRVSATKMKTHFGRCSDRVLEAPLIVERNGEDRLVVLSVAQYRHLISLPFESDDAAAEALMRQMPWQAQTIELLHARERLRRGMA